MPRDFDNFDDLQCEDIYDDRLEDIDPEDQVITYDDLTDFSPIDQEEFHDF